MQIYCICMSLIYFITVKFLVKNCKNRMNAKFQPRPLRAISSYDRGCKEDHKVLAFWKIWRKIALKSVSLPSGFFNVSNPTLDSREAHIEKLKKLVSRNPKFTSRNSKFISCNSELLFSIFSFFLLLSEARSLTRFQKKTNILFISSQKHYSAKDTVLFNVLVNCPQISLKSTMIIFKTDMFMIIGLLSKQC